MRFHAFQPAIRDGIAFVEFCEECSCTRESINHMPDDDQVDHPKHYNSHPSGIECITIAEHHNFCIGNAIKYLWRADFKNGLEDLEKAKWYLEREIARRKKGTDVQEGG